MKKKSWYIAGVGVSPPDDFYDMVPERMRKTFRHRVSEFLNRLDGPGTRICDEIYALRLRRPYDGIAVVPTENKLTEPYVRRHLVGASLVVPVRGSFSEFLNTPEDDKQIAEAYFELVRRGMRRLDEACLIEAVEIGIAKARAAGYMSTMGKPFRFRVEGAKLLMETRYELRPTTKTCHFKIWVPGKPEMAYEQRFVVEPEPRDYDVVRLYEYTPVQGGVLKGNTLHMAETGWDGMVPNPDMSDHDVPLKKLERVVGPVERVK